MALWQNFKNYFGIGRAGLGTFGKQVKPIAVRARDLIKKSPVQIASSDPRKFSLLGPVPTMVRDIIRAVPRAAISAKISMTGEKEYKPKSALERVLLSQKTIKPVREYAKQEYGIPISKKSKWALPLGIAGMAMDITPFVPGKAGVKGAISKIAKSGSTKEIGALLKGLKIADKEIPSLAKRLTTITKPQEVESILKSVPKVKPTPKPEVKVPKPLEPLAKEARKFEEFGEPVKEAMVKAGWTNKTLQKAKPREILGWINENLPQRNILGKEGMVISAKTPVESLIEQGDVGIKKLYTQATKGVEKVKLTPKQIIREQVKPKIAKLLKDYDYYSKEGYPLAAGGVRSSAYETKLANARKNLLKTTEELHPLVNKAYGVEVQRENVLKWAKDLFPKAELGVEKVAPKVEIPTPPLQAKVQPAGAVSDQDLIKQLTKNLKGAKPIRGKQELLYTKARGQKLAKLVKAREKMAGEKGFYEELGALKGELPKAQFEPIRKQFTQENVDRLFNMIKENKAINEWDKVNAQVGLSKMLGEQGLGVPTRGEIEKLYQVYGKEFTETLLSMRPVMDKLKEAGMQLYNIPRSMLAGVGDLSATLMQNLMFAYRYPKLTADNFINELRYFANENNYKMAMDEIAKRPNVEIYNKAKLSFTDVSPIMQQREEQFMASWAEKIPGLGKLIRATGRAYTGFLNKMRADVADKLIDSAKQLGKDVNDPRFYESLGWLVNSATGRGSLGQLERVAPVLAQGLFSARKLAATFQMLNPVAYAKADPFIRKEALKTWLAFLAGGTTILGASQLLGAKTSGDSTNADFGKIKIGDTRFNVFGPYQQLAVLIGRMIRGYSTSSVTGKKDTLGEGYRGLTRGELFGRWLKSKEHPTLSLLWQGLAVGKDQVGRDFDWSTETLRRFIPMIVSDAYELYQEHGVKGLYGLIPTILGIPAQTYGKQIPEMKTTETGKPTIKFKPKEDLAETLVRVKRGKEISNIPKEQWPELIKQKELKTKTEIEKEKLKEGISKKQIKVTKLEGKITKMPDGSFTTFIDGKLKTFKGKEEVKKYQTKLVIKDFEKHYGTKSKRTADYLLETDRLKRANNIEGWVKSTKKWINYLDKYRQLLDPNSKEYVSTTNKIEDLLVTYQKYASYGGFKKPKKGRKGKKARVLKPQAAPKLKIAVKTPTISKTLGIKIPTATRQYGSVVRPRKGSYVKRGKRIKIKRA
jgi:hypothetical protein